MASTNHFSLLHRTSAPIVAFRRSFDPSCILFLCNWSNTQYTIASSESFSERRLLRTAGRQLPLVLERRTLKPTKTLSMASVSPTMFVYILSISLFYCKFPSGVLTELIESRISVGFASHAFEHSFLDCLALHGRNRERNLPRTQWMVHYCYGIGHLLKTRANC